MTSYRLCHKCHKKYDIEEFRPATSHYCRPCTNTRIVLEKAFEAMLTNPNTGLRKLNTYMDKWYSVNV